jgi:hypothetical protein
VCLPVRQRPLPFRQRSLPIKQRSLPIRQRSLPIRQRSVPRLPLLATHVSSQTRSCPDPDSNYVPLGCLLDGTQLDAWIHESKFMVEAFGTGDSVAEIGQQLSWLGAVLRSSPYESGVAYCIPFISDICVGNALPAVFRLQPRSDILCKIYFTIQEREERLEPSSGQC